jgi:two-component system CheB/CheR fusion protein
VLLRWTVERNGGGRLLRVTWQEFGGPPVSPPTRTGFGGSLIERSLPGATVHREFAGDGLVCTIELEVPEEQDNAVQG